MPKILKMRFNEKQFTLPEAIPVSAAEEHALCVTTQNALQAQYAGDQSFQSYTRSLHYVQWTHPLINYANEYIVQRTGTHSPDLLTLEVIEDQVRKLMGKETGCLAVRYARGVIEGKLKQLSQDGFGEISR